MTTVRHTRVLVCLDPAAPHETALQVLAGLAAAEAAEIHGLFVEDLNLLKLARLPNVREFSFDSAAGREITPELIERGFRAHATRMSALIEKFAQRMAARHSFRIARGEFLAELMKASAGFDILVLAHSRSHFGPRLAMRANLTQLLESGPRTLIFVQERWPTGQRVAVLFDGTPESQAALALAADVARSEGLRLSVLLPHCDDEAHLEDEARETLGEGIDVRFKSLDLANTSELGRAAATEDARVLVIPSGETQQTRQLIIDLLDRVDCSIITTR